MTTYRRDNDRLGQLKPLVRTVASLGIASVGLAYARVSPWLIAIVAAVHLVLLAVQWRASSWGHEIEVTPERFIVKRGGVSRFDVAAPELAKIMVSPQGLFLVVAREKRRSTIIIPVDSFLRTTYASLRDETIALAPDRIERRDRPAAERVAG